jgi:hypothetical protein
MQTATGSQLGIVIIRACPTRGTPEGKMWLSVISFALVQSGRKRTSKNSMEISDAQCFLDSARLDTICDIIGLESSYVKGLITKHATWKRVQE